MLDPRRLAVLREFAAQGTIARAAEALSFTPSAVSQQLSQLQRESGVALFRRAGRRLELTDAGRMLAARAGELLARLEEVEAELAQAAGDVRGTVRVAAFQTAARALVLPAIDQLAVTHPNLRMELVELEGEESLPLVARGGVELAIAEEYEHAPRPHMAGLERAYLDPDEMVLALPAAHAAADDDPVALAALQRPRVGDRARGDRLLGHGHAGLPRRRGLRARRPVPRERHGPAARLVAGGRAAAVVPTLGRPERRARRGGAADRGRRLPAGAVRRRRARATAHGPRRPPPSRRSTRPPDLSRRERDGPPRAAAGRARRAARRRPSPPTRAPTTRGDGLSSQKEIAVSGSRCTIAKPTTTLMPSSSAAVRPWPP